MGHFLILEFCEIHGKSEWAKSAKIQGIFNLASALC